MGVQSRSMPGMRQALEFVHSGKIGPVKFARAICYRLRNSIGLVGTQLWAVMGSIFLAGALLLGIQMTLSAFIVGNYPTALRATAIGSVQAAGRFGSLLGPLLAGLLLSLGVPLVWIFIICAVPALLAAGALALLEKLSVLD